MERNTNSRFKKSGDIFLIRKLTRKCTIFSPRHKYNIFLFLDHYDVYYLLMYTFLPPNILCIVLLSIGIFYHFNELECIFKTITKQIDHPQLQAQVLFIYHPIKYELTTSRCPLYTLKLETFTAAKWVVYQTLCID